MTSTHLIIAIAVCCLLGMYWFIKANLKPHPKATIITIMAVLIFFITGATIYKTYNDYGIYISDAHGVMVSNITFAIFLDFSVLIIGGLFLYMANELYMADKYEEDKVAEAKKKAEEITKHPFSTKKP